VGATQHCSTTSLTQSLSQRYAPFIFVVWSGRQYLLPCRLRDGLPTMIMVVALLSCAGLMSGQTSPFQQWTSAVRYCSHITSSHGEQYSTVLPYYHNHCHTKLLSSISSTWWLLTFTLIAVIMAPGVCMPLKMHFVHDNVKGCKPGCSCSHILSYRIQCMFLKMASHCRSTTICTRVM